MPPVPEQFGHVPPRHNILQRNNDGVVSENAVCNKYRLGSRFADLQSCCVLCLTDCLTEFLGLPFACRCTAPNLCHGGLDSGWSCTILPDRGLNRSAVRAVCVLSTAFGDRHGGGDELLVGFWRLITMIVGQRGGIGVWRG